MGGERRSTRVALGIATVALVAVGGTVVWLRQGAHDVSVEDALASYRAAASAEDDGRASSTTAPTEPADAAAPSPTAATSPEPAPAPGGATTGESGAAPVGAAASATAIPDAGVYVYDTTGFEETDALGGIHRDYPAQTTMTVHPGGCGWTMRWQPLEERFDEWVACADGDSRTMQTFTTYHEFFQRGQREDFDCTADGAASEWLPADRTVGRTWTWACASPSSRVDSTSTIVGIETVDVGGTPVEAVHVRYDNVLSGSNEGTHVLEWWCDPETGLALRMVQTMTTRSDSPFGKVSYREEFDVRLTSLEPQR